MHQPCRSMLKVYAQELKVNGGARAANGAARKMERGTGANAAGNADAGAGAANASRAGGPA